MTDILEDLKQRLAQIGFVDVQIDKVVMDVRHDWAGERVYIKAGYTFRRQNHERNMAIIRDYKSGMSQIELTKKYKLCKQHVWKIIHG